MPIHRLCLDDDYAEISSHGGQLLRWQCGGQQRLFLSPHARFAPGQAIRGGVPVIFPQFNARGPYPRHGFARLQDWRVEPINAARLQLVLRDSADTLAQWPHAFRLSLEIALQPRAIRLDLSVENTGAAAFEFSAALHTYLALQLNDARVDGLDQSGFEETGVWHAPGAASVPALAAPIDRIYGGGAPVLRISDPGPRLELSREGFADWVVWNPGVHGAAALDDLGGEQAERFLCVEPGQILQPLRLQPGARWCAGLSLRVLDHG